MYTTATIIKLITSQMYGMVLAQLASVNLIVLSVAVLSIFANAQFLVASTEGLPPVNLISVVVTMLLFPSGEHHLKVPSTWLSDAADQKFVLASFQ